ncbi:glycosyltransferase [Clostridium sp.]|uniref:glycosyltransferase family 2 protein n=1 Tax=Clostridium sp. TaxID=1506 RepID=UPI0028513156|nr:glycosyltransferase [Clostridium sp.]MDR3594097.1 glycosyltransferase [Clostridium sp.]
MTLIEIKLQIIKSLAKKNIKKAYAEFEKLILQLELTKNENLAFAYYEYALLLFETYWYEESLYMFNHAYNLNYKKKEIKDLIYNHFITTKLTEFKIAYEDNLNQYNSDHINISKYKYEDLLLDFIPITDNKYYIYDKELDQFNGFIDFSEENISDEEKFKFDDDFSDILIIDEWNLSNIKPVMNTAKDKVIYYLCESPLKMLSFFKIPNILDEYLNNVVLFESKDMLSKFFRKHRNIYLPHIILAGDIEILKQREKEVQELINQEHSYRLSINGRYSNNILLSICIPTWNRGHRALECIKSLMKLKYDSEIEFLISNNGSKKTTEYYDEIEKLSHSDSRITYFKFESNQGFFKNFCNTLKIASGKFILLVSDEDMVVNEILPQYMSILNSNQTFGVLRSKTKQYYSHINEDLYIKAGDDAILNFFVRNNYLTGIIYNREIIQKYNLINFITNNENNLSCILYPHMWLDSAILVHADFMQKATMLCIEGTQELQSQTDALSENTLKEDKFFILAKLNNIPIHSSYQSRIEQHKSWIDLINQLPINNHKTRISLYMQLCWKTNFLTSVIKDIYIKSDYDWDKIYDEIYTCCIQGISKLNINLDEDIVQYITNYIRQCNQKFRQ